MVRLRSFLRSFGAGAPSGVFVRWIAPFLFATIGLILVNIIWLVPAIQNIRRSASVLALEISRRVETGIDTDLRIALREAENAADEIALEPERTAIILNRLLRERPNMARIARVGHNGRELEEADRAAIKGVHDVREMQGLYDVERWHRHAAHSHFYTALQGVANFGDVAVSPERGPNIILAVPIRRDGKVEEVLIVDMDLSNLKDAIDDVSYSGGHMYVVDRNGFQIAHPDAAEILKRKNFMGRPIVQKVIVDGRVSDGLAPEDEYINERGESVFTVGFPISIAGMGLFFEQPRRSALARERQMLLFAGAAMVLGLAMLAVILRSNFRLTELNASTRELLMDLDNAGKMLVRRDLELTRANTRLEELDQVKSEFVTIAAHQLRTPLTGIRWSYQTMLEEDAGALTSTQRQVLEGGLGASLRMIGLVNDLLSVARIEEGRLGLHFTMSSPIAMIERAVQRFVKAAQEKGITFSVEIPDRSIPAFAFDEEKISLVLDNMLDNAIKYTEPGGKITFSVAQEGGVVKIIVADTGIGIPKGDTYRVFSKFFRADNALRFHTSGSGLGLYVAKNIVEKHNGTMSVESAEGKGSVFTVVLPLTSSV